MAEDAKNGLAMKILSFIPDVSWKLGALVFLGGIGVSFVLPKGVSTSLNDEEKSIVSAISKLKEQRVRHEFSDTVTLQYVPDPLSKTGKCYVRINGGMTESSYGPQRIHSNWDISYQLLYGKDENISAMNRVGQGKEIRMKGSSSGNIFVSLLQNSLTRSAAPHYRPY